MCEDCGSCFSGGYGLAFHKSRYPNCTKSSETHPALLAYKPTDDQLLHKATGPTDIPKIAEDPSQERTGIVIRNAESSLGSTVPEVTAAVRCGQKTSTSNAEVGKKMDSVTGQRMSIFSNAIPVEDLGLSSDSSNEEDFMSSSKSHLRPESDAKQTSSVKQMSSVEESAHRQVSFPLPKSANFINFIISANISIET